MTPPASSHCAATSWDSADDSMMPRSSRSHSTFVPADSTTALVAFPVNRSRGAPNAAYERVVPETPFDPGRSEVRLYAFASTDVAADGSTLTGAPLGFGASGPPGDAALFTWFTGVTVPAADLPARPTGLPPIVTTIRDTFAVGIATVIIAIAVALPAWLASLIVFAAMLLVTALLVLVGRTQVKKSAPPKPERAIENLREDVAAVKGGLHS